MCCVFSDSVSTPLVPLSCTISDQVWTPRSPADGYRHACLDEDEEKGCGEALDSGGEAANPKCENSVDETYTLHTPGT